MKPPCLKDTKGDENWIFVALGFIPNEKPLPPACAWPVPARQDRADRQAGKGQCYSNVNMKHFQVKIDKRILAFIEIGVVVLSGFIMSIAMKWFQIEFFTLPHLAFLFTAIFFRSLISNWKLQDYGLKFYDMAYQIRLGVLVWAVKQTYHTLLQFLSPLFHMEGLGAMVFNIKTIDSLWDKIVKIALFKAGIIESLRYFSYIQGFLMEVFGLVLGSFMTFVYFGTSHMGIMNIKPESCVKMG